jgi:hypothetical protein
LQQPDKEERHLVVGKLLTQANTWSGIERYKNERVWCEVFLNSLVKETVRIKFLGYV